MALSDQGVLFSWGGGGKDFNKGQTGHNTLDDIESPTPIQFFRDKPILTFSCGGFHNTALTTDGEVYSWGSGQFGQLGLGYFDHEKVPKKIDTISKEKIV